jgi:hypothetical protein
MKVNGLVEELTYRCYCFNREQNPSTAPQEWAPIFGADKVAAMERRYQQEGTPLEPAKYDGNMMSKIESAVNAAEKENSHVGTN